MIFNDFGFLFLFLPIVVAFFYARAGHHRVWLLIAASAVFYGSSGLEHLSILVIDVTIVYLLIETGEGTKSPLRFWSSVLLPIIFLLYYKYSGFINEVVTAGDETVEVFNLFKDVVIPAGISFFTFQLIAYAVDRRIGRIAATPRFEIYALYVSFFPQLVAGPILRFGDVREAITRLDRFVPERSDIEAAAVYGIMGLSLKVLLADGLANVMEPFAGMPNDLAARSAVYVALGYSLQIYFDFYGYSLLAIGLGRLFGFRFPNNFAKPYNSLNPREFWRRWHITLSYWIRDYLYFPLGGNRRYAANILIIFAVCGLWHGAGWNFIVWGLYHGVLVLAYSVVRPVWDRLPPILATTLTFLLVTLGWPLFLYDFAGAEALLGALFGLGSGHAPLPGWSAWVFLAVCAVIAFGSEIETVAEKRRLGRLGPVPTSLILGTLLGLSILFVGSSDSFIYFRF